MTHIWPILYARISRGQIQWFEDIQGSQKHHKTLLWHPGGSWSEPKNINILPQLVEIVESYMVVTSTMLYFSIARWQIYNSESTWWRISSWIYSENKMKNWPPLERINVSIHLFTSIILSVFCLFAFMMCLFTEIWEKLTETNPSHR